MSRAKASRLGAFVVGLAACAAPPSPPKPPPPPPASPAPAAPAEVTLDASRPIVIIASEDALASGARDASTWADREREAERVRLRASVADLERVLAKLTGASVSVTSERGPSADAFTILVGAPAAVVYGAVGASDRAHQGYRVVVEPGRAALYGESDLATSYAVYELLHRLGCRWYFPGDLGEVLPEGTPMRLALGDEARAPSTLYRGVWYADDAWKRRNRTGGLLLSAGHALGSYVTDDERAAHPEWIATVAGRPAPPNLRWYSPEVAAHIAKRIVERDEKDPEPSFSIAIDDGDTFDDTPASAALDAGDRDPTTNKPSMTDPFLVLANRIADGVASRRPNVLLGFLAYGSTMRPPVRERVHPALVPQIAPITYSRAHPMNDDAVPHNAELRAAIDGWSRAAKLFSYYAYGYFLAEPSAPNPMLAKWGHDVPYVLGRGCAFWQPETLPNFETSMHALVMSTRLAFDTRERPDDVVREIDARLYGAAGEAMHAYWAYADDVWVKTPEYSGGKAGQLRRFTPERLARMRELLTQGARQARTPAEHARVAMAEDSLGLFEALMSMRRDLASGRFADLDVRAKRYLEDAKGLAATYAPSSAFTSMPWAPEGIYAKYFSVFDQPALEEASWIAKHAKVEALLRAFRWEKTDAPSLDGREKRGYDDRAWSTTDVALDTWSRLGLYDHFGSVWYRAHVGARALTKAHVWLGGVDGKARVFVNGREARLVSPGGSKRGAKPAGESGGGPMTFDASGLFREGDNVVAILATRTALSELGTGGLVGPVVIYRP